MFCDNSTAVAYVNNMSGKIMSLNCIDFPFGNFACRLTVLLKPFTFLELSMYARIGYRASMKAASNGNSILQSLSG